MSDQLERTRSSLSTSHADAGTEAVTAHEGHTSRGSSARDRQVDALRSAQSKAGKVSLGLQHGLPFEAWKRIGEQVGTLHDSSAWWVGDWLLYGQRSYPDRYRSAMDATGLSYQTLRNYAWIAGRYPVARRRDDLSFGHHAEVASLTEDDQDMWLLRSSLQKWSRNDLRRALRAELGAGTTAGSAQSGVAIDLSVGELRHARWRAAANANGRPLQEWITDVLDSAAANALIDARTADDTVVELAS
jgi:hypothetical protein